MKVLAKHISLKNLVQDHEWGIVGTNEYEDIKKAHLLDMRKGKRPLVTDFSPNKNYINSIAHFNRFRGGDEPYGKDWNNNFYGTTVYGIIVLRELFPEMKDDIDSILYDMF